MLHNIANKGHRVILAALTAALLVALFSTKAQAEFIIKETDRTVNEYIYKSDRTYGGYICPKGLEPLIYANQHYKFILNNLLEESKIAQLGSSNMLDMEVPKLKKLSAGLHDKAIADVKAAIDKTRAMLLDGCFKDYECVDIMGGKDCKGVVKYSPQDLIKRAEHYLK